MAIVTPPFRVSFPNLFVAKKNELSGQDEFSVVALFPLDADLKSLKTAMIEAAEKKWGKDQGKWPKNLRFPLRDQGEREKVDDKGKSFLPAGHEKGAKFLNLKSKVKPAIVDQRLNPIEDEAQLYAGCWARAAVTVYAYDKMGNRGVAIGLQHIQKVKEGEPLGGKIPVEQAFEPIEMEDVDKDGAAALFG